MPLNPVHRGGQPFSGHALEVWLRSPRGRRMLQIEDQEMRRLLPEVFGRHVLQVGNWGREGQLLASAETLHRAVLGTIDDRNTAALADPEHLPIETRSVDAVLLPHTLEFTRSPHNVLREVNRVLSDRGRLFVLGFNPWGWWAIRRLLGLGYRAFPGGARFYSVGRLFDWLELLDFEVAEVRRFDTGFPWQAPRSLGEPWSLGSLLAPFADGYVLVAKKRVIPVNLVGRLQRAQVRSLVGMPTPAASRDTLFSGSGSELPHPE